jgi:hypothetical protein
VALVLVVGLAPQLGTRVVDGIECALRGVTTGVWCGGRTPARGGEEPGAARRRREAALMEREQARAPVVERYGGRLAALAAEARAARLRGDLEGAEGLGRRLDNLLALLQAGPRGELLAGVTAPDEDAFDALTARATIYGDDGSASRYFRVAPAPGDGVLVVDFFIRQDRSGPLLGDDRGFTDPLRGGVPLDGSRMILVIDRETGRGVLRVARTCTVSAFGRSFCNEARPLTFDLGDRLADDPEHDATGEGINIDATNRFEITGDGEGVSVRYDALNSVTPLVVSVDGRMELRRGADGVYELAEEDRDDYPAIGVYQYLPDGRYVVIDEAPGVDVVPGALPHCDLPDLPDLPGGLPDLPDLPRVPGPC